MAQEDREVNPLGLPATGSPPSRRPERPAALFVRSGSNLEKAGIRFTPLDGGRHSHAATDEEGHYELKYLRDVMGAKVGQHKVRISTANESEKKVELVPPRYNASSTLERAVQAGDNEIDFELSSK